MSIILKVANNQATQDELRKTLSLLNEASEVFKEAKSWVNDLSKIIKSQKKDDLSGLADDEIWQFDLSEWFERAASVRKSFKELASDLAVVSLPNAPVVKGKSPNENVGDAASLLNPKYIPEVVPHKPVFYGSSIAYKIKDLKEIEKAFQQWLNREGEIESIKKALVSQSKSPKFK